MKALNSPVPACHCSRRVPLFTTPHNTTETEEYQDPASPAQIPGFPPRHAPPRCHSSCPTNWAAGNQDAWCTPRIPSRPRPSTPSPSMSGALVLFSTCTTHTHLSNHGGRHCAPVWRRTEGMRSWSSTSEHALTGDHRMASRQSTLGYVIHTLIHFRGRADICAASYVPCASSY